VRSLDRSRSSSGDMLDVDQVGRGLAGSAGLAVICLVGSGQSMVFCGCSVFIGPF